MPELSIIVPVYKVEKYLPKCIDSILAQTFRDFELILIDDGSPDNCGTICDDYAARDSRIKVIHQENAGVSAARNAGLDIATGTYLGFVDSDDWIEPEMYETMIATAKEKQVDVVVCGANVYEENGTFMTSGLSADRIYDNEGLMAALFGTPNPIGGGCVNKLFRTSAAGSARFPIGVKMAEDWLYLFKALTLCRSGCHIQNNLYCILHRLDSATRVGRPEDYYEVIVSSKHLMDLAREQSFDLEKKGTYRFLNDCLYYGKMIRELGQNSGQRYQCLLIRVRGMMIEPIVRSYQQKLFSKASVHGFIKGMIDFA